MENWMMIELPLIKTCSAQGKQHFGSSMYVVKVC